jgi:hypothetical protein
VTHFLPPGQHEAIVELVAGKKKMFSVRFKSRSMTGVAKQIYALPVARPTQQRRRARRKYMREWRKKQQRPCYLCGKPSGHRAELCRSTPAARRGRNGRRPAPKGKLFRKPICFYCIARSVLGFPAHPHTLHLAFFDQLENPRLHPFLAYVMPLGPFSRGKRVRIFHYSF